MITASSADKGKYSIALVFVQPFSTTIYLYVLQWKFFPQHIVLKKDMYSESNTLNLLC